MKAKRIIASVMATTMLFAAAGCYNGDVKHGVFHDNDGISADEDNIQAQGIKSSDSWMDKGSWYTTVNGIDMTKTGRFKFPMGEVTAGDIAYVPAFVTIDENYEDCEDGYKNVVAICTFRNDPDHEGMWVSVFDKYTGCSFDCNEYLELYEGCYETNYSVREFKVGEHDVHVEWTTITEQKEYVSTITLIVKCPEEYVGSVFMFGPNNLDGLKIWESCDWDNRLYTIDKTGYYGDDFVYFTLEAKQAL